MEGAEPLRSNCVAEVDMGTYSIYGQKRIKKLLEANISRNRLAHAYLFHGEPGVGKDAVAIGMAMGLNCAESRLGGCGLCDSCKKIRRLEHPAFRMVYPMPTRPKSLKEDKFEALRREILLQRMKNPYAEPAVISETTTLPIIGIESVSGVKRELNLKLFSASYRVFLFSHADRMTIPAANSLLKMLEEPPPGTVFFLTTSAPGQILPTIMSRCQRMRFDSLAESDITEALVEHWQHSRDQAIFFARLSGGSLRQALEFSAEGYLEKRNGILSFLESCLNKDPEVQWAAIKPLIEIREKQEIISILQVLIVLMRDIFCMQSGEPQKILNEDRVESFKRFILHYPDFSVDHGIRFIQLAIDRIQKNAYLPLVLLELKQQMISGINRKET